MRLDKFIPEKYLHFSFEVGVLLKGIDGLLEVIGGLALFFVSPSQINALVNFFTRYELSEDPHDLVANYLVKLSHDLFLNAGLFVALYLLSHGIVKLLIVGGLWKDKLWAYPVGIIVFAGFVVYQIYRYTFTFDAWLLILTVLDIIIIWLTWHEYEYRRRSKPVNS